MPNFIDAMENDKWMINSIEPKRYAFLMKIDFHIYRSDNCYIVIKDTKINNDSHKSVVILSRTNNSFLELRVYTTNDLNEIDIDTIKNKLTSSINSIKRSIKNRISSNKNRSKSVLFEDINIFTIKKLSLVIDAK